MAILIVLLYLHHTPNQMWLWVKKSAINNLPPVGCNKSTILFGGTFTTCYVIRFWLIGPGVYEMIFAEPAGLKALRVWWPAAILMQPDCVWHTARKFTGYFAKWTAFRLLRLFYAVLVALEIYGSFNLYDARKRPSSQSESLPLYACELFCVGHCSNFRKAFGWRWVLDW